MSRLWLHKVVTLAVVAGTVTSSATKRGLADPFYEIGVGIADATGPITDVCSSSCDVVIVPQHALSGLFVHLKAFDRSTTDRQLCSQALDAPMSTVLCL